MSALTGGSKGKVESLKQQCKDRVLILLSYEGKGLKCIGMRRLSELWVILHHVCRNTPANPVDEVDNPFHPSLSSFSDVEE